MLNNQLYDEIKSDYARLKDNDPIGAYDLMKKATEAERYYGEQRIEYSKNAKLTSVEADVHKDRVSTDKAPKDSTSGNRYGRLDDNYQKQLKASIAAESIVDRLLVMERYCQRVSFQCNTMWERANREQFSRRNV